MRLKEMRRDRRIRDEKRLKEKRTDKAKGKRDSRGEGGSSHIRRACGRLSCNSITGLRLLDPLDTSGIKTTEIF
ncbi:hypothetical protein Q8A67_023420 [Cirrhinus molitorella]|uniref:Uncharacterized protein n=1 Tax=Cirrhinus molitorella TaxID=172907 RepID=A0AA88TEA4_9TELE|nr:hypothetical protein Q8A67_023420 [Cirrhinus molitorella]